MSQPTPTKLKIVPFTDKELQQQDKTVPEFELPVNPDQFSQRFEVKYEITPPHGAQGMKEKFIYSGPEELRLEFILDGTGTIMGYSDKQAGKTVSQQIEDLKKVAYKMEGGSHKPRFLKLIGLGITFDCILTDLQITYTLFKPDGSPLRAKISATFLNYMETKRRVLEQNKKSPDLTHVRTVTDDLNLPLMTYRMYNDPKYYLEVAKVNKLTNFRTLRHGQELIFPPIDKTMP